MRFDALPSWPILLRPLQLLPWEQAQSSGVDRIARSHLDFGPGTAGLTSSLFVLVMNPASYRELSDDLKAVLDANSGPDAAAWLGKVLEEAAAAAR